MLKFAFLFICIFGITSSFGQRVYNIKYAKDEIKIDGDLNEESWQNAATATDFTMNFPNVGAKASHKTEVYLIYSDDAIYFGAKVYDDKDSISYFLSQRDNFGNADYIGLTIDTYGNYLNAFAFYVTPSGVELDALVNEENFDYSWNAVWKSRVQTTDYGWSVEMRIPYSAIRFPNQEVQNWNINFERQTRRTREIDYWNPVDPTKYGEITQAGKLDGVRDIKPPLRLSFSPYTIGYLENNYVPGADKQVFRQRVTGGMDLKWGLNDAFTLDMTLVPDFGQTVSDNQILNLGPFEVQFAENRSFFKEGTDLFGIGGVFYSRRIGGTPYYASRPYQNLNDSLGERVVSESTKAPLLNATKVSGRTKKGLGIGVFNAIEGRTTATIQDSLGNTRTVETNPLTNYNVTVFSQNLKNNGRVSVLNTHVAREGDAGDANVTVLGSQFFTKDRNYSITTFGKISNKMEVDKNTFGHSFYSYVAKVQGSYRYGLSYYEESDTYDPNDLGFLYNNNSRSLNVDWQYSNFVPKGKFLRKYVNMNLNYEELYFPRLFSNFNYSLGVVGTLRNFLTMGLNGDVSPIGYIDHFESRNFGIPVNFAPSFRVGGFYSSDYSKPFALDFRFNRRTFLNKGQAYNYANISPRFQLSTRMFLVYSLDYEYYSKDYGYVTPVEDVEGIVLGTRNRDIVTNSVSGELIFSKRMGMNVRFRHYWQRVNYQYFSDLQEDGNQVRNAYNPVNELGVSRHNTSFNAFTVDINYKWVFYPGCEFLIFFKNNIFSSVNDLDNSYFSTFNTLFDQPQINSLSGKLLIFIDALYLRPKKKSKV